MESKIKLRIKSRLQKVIGKNKPQCISTKKITELLAITPKFSNETKFPFLLPNRSLRSLPKPYPISKITLIPTLKESASLIMFSKPFPQLSLKKSRRAEERQLRNKEKSPIELKNASKLLLSRSYLIDSSTERNRSKSPRLPPLSSTPDPW